MVWDWFAFRAGIAKEQKHRVQTNIFSFKLGKTSDRRSLIAEQRICYSITDELTLTRRKTNQSINRYLFTLPQHGAGGLFSQLNITLPKGVRKWNIYPTDGEKKHISESLTDLRANSSSQFYHQNLQIYRTSLLYSIEILESFPLQIKHARKTKSVHMKYNTLYFYWYLKKKPDKQQQKNPTLFTSIKPNMKVKICSNKYFQNTMQGNQFSFAFDYSVESVWRPVASRTRYS